MPDYSRVMFVRHKNKEILQIDFSKCKYEEFLVEVEKTKGIVSEQAPKSILTLTLVNDFNFNKEITRSMKELAAHNHPFIKAAAVVGVTGLKKIIFDAIQRVTGREFRFFNDIESAKEWLVTQ